jgi:DNA-binding transcriptional ArsR family regulator
MNTNQVARIAALIGEPARAAMLLALMDGRALTARELAGVAGIGAAAASRHLALMVEAALLQVLPQGRHRYHRLASPEVARMLEEMMQFAVRTGTPLAPQVAGPRDAALRLARTCYDHVAGRLGVAMADHLLAEGAVHFDDEGGGQLTERAAAVLALLGIAPEALAAGGRRRLPCRPCLDWSERRPHLAGRLGALLCAHCLDKGWLMRRGGTRALQPSPQGVVALRDWLGSARWAQVAG